MAGTNYTVGKFSINIILTDNITEDSLKDKLTALAGFSTGDKMMYLITVKYPGWEVSKNDKTSITKKTNIYPLGYRLGDVIGVTVTSDEITKENIKSVDFSKLVYGNDKNSVKKTIGNGFDAQDYFLVAVPQANIGKAVHFTFTQIKPKDSSKKDLITGGKKKITLNTANDTTEAEAVKNLSVTNITVTSADTKKYSVTLSWEYNKDVNKNKLPFDKITGFAVKCEYSILPINKTVTFSGSKTSYSVTYDVPITLKTLMENNYENTNKLTDTIPFKVYACKGLIVSNVATANCTVTYKRPIQITDIWIQGGSRTSTTKYRVDMTYTALSASGNKVWDDSGDTYTELKVGWTTNEAPKKKTVKVHTYFSPVTAKADILRLGTETDVSSSVTGSGTTYYYSYPAYLDRTLFERNGSITTASNYNNSDIAHNSTRYVVFEVIVEDANGVKASKQSPIVKIERRPIIRNYMIDDEETGGKKYYNYENGFNFNLYPAVTHSDLDDVLLSWGVDAITLREWLGLDINTDKKTLDELLVLYTKNFFKNVLTTYERFRNVISPVWFELYLVIKSDAYFKIVDNGSGGKKLILMTPIDADYKNHMGNSGLIMSTDGTHEPEYEYLIDVYDKDFADWVLSADHQHRVNIDKDDFAFYESNVSKIKTIINASIIKYNNAKYKGNKSDNPTTFNIGSMTNTGDELIMMFRRLVDEGYLTFRLQQYEYLPSIYNQTYPVHWECPVCSYKFVTAKMDNTDTLYLFDGSNPSSYYKKATINSATDVVPTTFNTIRRDRKGYACPICGYKPSDYEIKVLPDWLARLINIPQNIGLPMTIGPGLKTQKEFTLPNGTTVKRAYWDLYDYNNRLDKVVMGLFYSGQNETEEAFKKFYQVMAYIFSGQFVGDAIQTILGTKSETNATDSINTTGIKNFKQLFSTTNSYMGEFRDFYKATCEKCGHELYLDVLVCDKQTILCPYCLHNNINATISAVKNGNTHYKPSEILRTSLSTASDTDFFNFYHKAGTLDLDVMAHYCPTGTINVTSVNTNAKTPKKEIKEELEIIDQKQKVSWTYTNSYGLLSGFTVSLGLSATNNNWKTIVSSGNGGITENLLVPNTSNGVTSYSFDILNETAQQGDTHWSAKVTQVNNTVTCDLEFTLNSVFGSGLSYPFKLAIEIRPYVQFNTQRLYGKTRTYRKHDASNWDGMYTDYGTVEYTYAYANIMQYTMLKDAPPPIEEEWTEPEPPIDPPEPPPQEPIIARTRGNIDTIYPVLDSSNLYNVTPRVDNDIQEETTTFAGNYQWMGKRNPLLAYKLYFDSDTSDVYTIMGIDLSYDHTSETNDLVGKDITDDSMQVDEYDYEIAILSTYSYAAVERFDENTEYDKYDIVGYDNVVYECVSELGRPATSTVEEIRDFEDRWSDIENRILQINTLEDSINIKKEYYELTEDRERFPGRDYYVWDNSSHSFVLSNDDPLSPYKTYYQHYYDMKDRVSSCVFAHDDYEKVPSDASYNPDMLYYEYDEYTNQYVEIEVSGASWDPVNNDYYIFVEGNIYVHSLFEGLNDRFPNSDINNSIKMSETVPIIDVDYEILNPEAPEYIEYDSDIYNPSLEYFIYNSQDDAYYGYDGGEANWDPEHVTYYIKTAEKILVPNCCANDIFELNTVAFNALNLKYIVKALGSRDFRSNFYWYFVTDDTSPREGKRYYTFSPDPNQYNEYHYSSFQPGVTYYEQDAPVYNMINTGDFGLYAKILEFSGTLQEWEDLLDGMNLYESFEFSEGFETLKGYMLTDDTEPQAGKTYYYLSKTQEEIMEELEITSGDDYMFGLHGGVLLWNYDIVESNDNQFIDGNDYYEYVITRDTEYVPNHTYYELVSGDYVEYEGDGTGWIQSNMYELILTEDSTWQSGKHYFCLNYDVCNWYQSMIMSIKLSGLEFTSDYGKRDAMILKDKNLALNTPSASFTAVTLYDKYFIENISEFVDCYLSCVNLTKKQFSDKYSQSTINFSPSVSYTFTSNSYSRVFNATDNTLFKYNSSDILSTDDSIKRFLILVLPRVGQFSWYNTTIEYDPTNNIMVQEINDEFEPLSISNNTTKLLCDFMELLFLVNRNDIYELYNGSYVPGTTYYTYNEETNEYELYTDGSSGWGTTGPHYTKPYNYDTEISILETELSDMIDVVTSISDFVACSINELMKYMLYKSHNIPLNSGFAKNKFLELPYREYTTSNSYEYCWMSIKTLFNDRNEFYFENSTKPLLRFPFIQDQHFDFKVKHFQTDSDNPKSLGAMPLDFSYQFLCGIYEDNIGEFSDDLVSLINANYYVKHNDEVGKYEIIVPSNDLEPIIGKFYFRINNVTNSYYLDQCYYLTDDPAYDSTHTYYLYRFDLLDGIKYYEEYEGDGSNWDEIKSSLYEFYFEDDVQYYEFNEKNLYNTSLINSNNTDWTPYEKDVSYNENTLYGIGDLVTIPDYYPTVDTEPKPNTEYYIYLNWQYEHAHQFVRWTGTNFLDYTTYYRKKDTVSSTLYNCIANSKYYEVEDLLNTDYWEVATSGIIPPDENGRYNIVSQNDCKVYVKFNEQGPNISLSSFNYLPDLKLDIDFKYLYTYAGDPEGYPVTHIPQDEPAHISSKFYTESKYVLTTDTEYNPEDTYYTKQYIEFEGNEFEEGETYYETSDNLHYFETEDLEPQDGKTYYTYLGFVQYDPVYMTWVADIMYDLIITETQRQPLSLTFCDRREQSSEADAAIFADTDGAVLKYCPRCGRVHRSYNNSSVSNVLDYYYLYQYKTSGLLLDGSEDDDEEAEDTDDTELEVVETEDSEYSNPIIYDKHDMINRETIGTYPVQSNDELTDMVNTFDGVYCSECTSEQIDYASVNLSADTTYYKYEVSLSKRQLTSNKYVIDPDNCIVLASNYEYVLSQDTTYHRRKTYYIYRTQLNRYVVYTGGANGWSSVVGKVYELIRTDNDYEYYFDADRYMFVSPRYYVTSDATPQADKTYYIYDSDIGQYIIVDVSEGFVTGTIYYENDSIVILTPKSEFLISQTLAFRFNRKTYYDKNVRLKYRYHNIELQNVSESAVMLQAIGDDEGAYWAVRNAEIFNGFYNNHTPTYTLIGRNKDISPNKYVYLIDKLAETVNTVNENFVGDDSRLSILKFGEIDTTVELPETGDTIIDDDFPAITLREDLDIIIGEDTE